MRFVFKILLISGLSYLVQSFFPWWSMAIVAFVIGAAVKTFGLRSFLSGFLGIGLLWAIMAWNIDSLTNSILTNKMATLFKLEQPFLMIVLTGLVGALVGGMAALSGAHFRLMFSRKKRGEYYS